MANHIKNSTPIPQDGGKGPSWIAIVATAVFQVWPVSALLLFLKLRANSHNKKLASYRTCLNILSDSPSMSIRRLASKMGKNIQDTTIMLEAMIQNNYLGPEAHIDHSRRMLFLFRDESETKFEDERFGVTDKTDLHFDFNIDNIISAAETFAHTIKNEFQGEYVGRGRGYQGSAGGHPYAPNGSSDKSSASNDAGDTIYEVKLDSDAAKAQREAFSNASPRAHYEAPKNATPEENETIQKLHRLNDSIMDANVSEKIDRIAQITGDIYAFIELNPDRAGEVRKFMNYYLPTTLKLLSSYSMLERQSYQGENIQASRKNIEDILDTLVHAFEKQLDRLFAADAVDISSDIQVLETMIAKDGLARQAMQLKL